MRGCPMRDFTEDVFTPLVQLQRMFASNSKLCCPANLPDNEGFEGCSAPEDPSTSCDSLLYSNAYRVLLIVFASLALGGNMGGFVYRMFINKDEESHSCGVMVTHLCMSDFLMGVYLVVIGVADTRYGSSYFIYSDAWERSAGCKAAGFLSLLSCEASAFFVCLLTIDRMAAFRFPNSRLHFRKGSAQLTCWMIWFAAVFMAAVPLIESHWRFYGETGTCLPLPTNARSFDGRDYSFAVLIMLNFVLFLIIAVGQALIYCSVRARRHKTLGVNSDYMSLERSITKRLIAIALTDFLCWFPVCLVGFMASGGGARMPRHIDTALSVAVLPLNSAINPFIYTLVMIRETRRHGNSRPRDFLESETSFMMT
ncbi:G-protein coupled receptor GRL101-like [Babylonia areolata]|uniref:G-protein coupled receptor GRL101-like n=1 Tax=Babylonia areolata TaxID=304850 RepID=UPI003FD57126